MKISLCIGIILLLFTTVACQTPALYEKEKLNQELEEAFSESKSVGAAVLITDNDSVIFEQYFGFADLAAKRKVDAQSLFGVGSITKTFTTLAIMKLVEEGKFNLEDRLIDILPELAFRNKWQANYPLRLYHLLEHTSGFDDMHPKDWAYPLDDDNFGLDQAVALTANSMVPRWEPGSRFAYSNVNFVLAGYIIDKYSENGYDAFMQKHIFSPMGMEESSLLKDELDPLNLALSYGNDRKARPFKHIVARPAGSVFSSSKEMGMFMRTMLREPQDFLAVKSWTELKKHHSIAEFAGTQNGFRLGLRPSFQHGRLWLGHGGAYNNYKSVFYFNQELELGIFIVTNGPNSVNCLNRLEKKVFEHIQTDKIEADSVTIKKVAKPEKYTGYYNFGSPRVQLLYPFSELYTEGLKIREEDGQLFMANSGQGEKALYPKGEGRFSFSAKGEGFDWIFPADKPGVLYSSLGFYYQKKSWSGLMLLGASLVFALLLALSSQLIIFIRMFYRIKKGVKIFRSEYLLGASSSLLLLGIFCFLFGSTQANLHEPQFMSIMLFVASLVFPFFAVAGLYFWVRDGKEMKGLNWTYQGLLALALLFIAGYLYYWDMLGFAFWMY